MLKGAALLLLGLVTGASVATALGSGAGADPEPAPANAANECTRPAYLLVLMDNLDRSKTAAYGAALRETQVVAKHGGSYLTFGAPSLMLEGEWPDGRSIVLEQYPCLDAIRAFWFSDTYQDDVLPLRAGSGDYTVAAFEAYQRGGD